MSFVCVLFLTFELLFFNVARNMNYGRKFHFILYSNLLYIHLKFQKSSRFFRVFLTLKLKVMIFEVYVT